MVLLLCRSAISRRSIALWGAILTPGLSLVGADPARSDSAQSDVVVLSPFEVSTSHDLGYETNDTLSGTRLDTPSKFVGAAVTEITAQEMQDLALANMQDLLNFVPNSSSYFGGGISSDPTGNGPLFGISYLVRGNVVTSASRDFIKDRVYEDAYNVGRFSFTRGPNSILFGVGSPGGLVNSVSQRAEYKNSYNYSFRTDSNGSYRNTFDINQKLVPKRLAFRLDGLNSDFQTNRKPSDRKDNRLFGTLTANPFSSTTLVISAEKGNYNALAVRPWPSSDGLTPWINAGQPAIPDNLLNGAINNATGPKGTPAATLGTAANAPGLPGTPSGYLGLLSADGLQMPRNFPYPGLTFSGSNALPLAPINMNGLIYPNRPFFYGTTAERDPTLINSPIPYTANVLGYGNRLTQHFNNQTINLEQAVGRDLNFELVYNRQHVDAINDYSSQNVDNIYRDPNPTLLGFNGAVMTNPNYLHYFVINDQPTSYEQHFLDQTYRATGSYKLDFSRHVSAGLAKWLGYTNFAGLEEKDTSFFVQNFAFLRNTNNAASAGVPQFAAAGLSNIQAAGNMVALINYLDPHDSSTWAFPDAYQRYPHLIYDGSPLPAPGANGIAPAWVVNNSSESLGELRSRMFVMQNVFLDERVATTFGWRRDLSNAWNPAPTTANLAHGGYVSNSAGTPVESVLPVRDDGGTKTVGFVAYPVPWIGLSYNQSNNFVPASSGVFDIFGNALPNSQGKGKDYGIKFGLDHNRLTGSFTFFTTDTTNVATTTLRSGPAGSEDVGRAAIQSTMHTLLPSDPLWIGTTYPWNNNYRDINDVDSKGYEFTVTANPFATWRLTANFSHQITASSNLGALEGQFLNYAQGLFAAGGPYAAYANTLAGPGETIQNRLSDIGAVLSRAQSLVGQADGRLPRYTGRLITAYDFRSQALRGWGIGGTFTYSSALITGYPYVPGNPGLFVASQPYFGDVTHLYGVFASYQFKLLGGHGCRLQLNIDNLLNDDGLHPLTEEDSGNGQPVVSRYSLGTGRTFVLSGSFDY